MSRLRALLILGRVSNLPTLWSNCVAGWLLGGGDWQRLAQEWQPLALLLLGATLLYLGGMFLNDACDAEFDRAHRPERPIPSGAFSAAAVWRFALGLLGSGMLCLALFGPTTALLALLLFNTILAYDFFHKRLAWAPLLMSLCRLLLYLVAASTARGVNGTLLWSALALAAYVTGLSYVARRESLPGAIHLWPCALLALPIPLALLINDGSLQRNALILSAILALWVARSLRGTFWSAERNVGATVSGLLAGIIWVDLLAVCFVPAPLGGIFLGLFLLTLLAQRFVPAT
jgi:4-hydroxybenzoate polyprenyltransferase